MPRNQGLPNGTASLKTEPGTSTQRLPSLKPPRDLSLSAFTSKVMPDLNHITTKKRIYTPNLNVQRNKNRENIIIKQDLKEVKPKPATPEKGKGRGKKTINLIQLNSGLFSDGLAPSLKSGRYGRSGGGGAGGGGGGGGGGGDATEKVSLQKPKLKKQENVKIDKNEEDMMLKELLRDDFVDDPGLDPDYDNCPVKLPLYESSLFSKDNVKKIKTEPDDKEDNCKGDSLLTKIKLEPGLEDNDPSKGNNILLKNIKTEPGLDEDSKGALTEVKLNNLNEKKFEDKRPKLPTIRDIIENKEPEFVMLHLPSCMPGLKPEVETRTGQNSQITSQNGTTAAATNSSSTEASPSNIPVEEPNCTLKTLKPGKIGKMQILKSGRVRFLLGETKLWLEMGTQVSFKQDLISVNLNRDSKTGNTICLGSVPLRMTVTPDWEQMLSSTKVS